MLARAAALLLLPFSAHAQIMNGDFSQDLTGWNVIEYGAVGALGTVVVPVDDPRALITENDSFLILLEQTFTVPLYAESLSFDVFVEPGFDDVDNHIADVFEARLLDANRSSLVPVWRAQGTAFFNIEEDGITHEAAGVTFDGTRVTVPVSALTPGSLATISFGMVNGDAGITSAVRVDGVAVYAPISCDVDPINCDPSCGVDDPASSPECDGICDPDDDALSPDCNDDCPGDADTDGDTVCDAVDACAGFDDLNDIDGDGIPDGCDDCGNGVVDAGEDCDDGNGISFDGCSPACTIDAPVPPIDCLGGGDPRGPKNLDEGNIVLYGDTRRGHFGRALSNIGDFNGDGFEDMAVSSYHDNTNGNDSGTTYIWFGPVAEGTDDVTSADMAILGPIGSHSGYSVNGVGDLDGDGRDDLIIGGWDENKRRNMVVSLVYGKATPPATLDLETEADAWFTSPNVGDGFGEEVNGIGDVNGDGVPDLAIGAPDDSTAGTGAGAVYIYTGGPYIGDVTTPPDATYFGLNDFAKAGTRIEGLGDFNDDGVDDFAIGSPKDDTGGSRAGAAFVFYGSPALPLGEHPLDMAADVTMFGNTRDRVGSSLANAGDVDGDNIPDLWVGAPFFAGSRRGAVYLLPGGPALSGPILLDTIWQARYLGRDAADLFGGDIAAQFDADGDGHLDAVVGALGADASSSIATGAAWILFGPHNGTTTVGEQGRRQGIMARGRAGSAVAAFSDLNGDGFGDVVISDRRVRYNGNGRAGMASVFYGGEVGDPGFTWYADHDGDGWGDAAATTQSCKPPPGFIDRADDCDDSRADVHPYAIEDDCSVSTDFNCDGVVGNEDNDGDGFVACANDCDDNDRAINPVAPELCADGIDNNCDGLSDDPSSSDVLTFYPDGDGDGFGADALGVASCDDPGLFIGSVVFMGGDCDDADEDVNPAGLEVCDTIDNDCDGTADEGSAVDAVVYYPDLDVDGAGDMFAHTTACSIPPGHVTNSTDCNDANASVRPGANEVCDRIDNDCDGARYLGGPLGLSGAWLDASGAAAGERFGETIATVPDLNGDGADELLIGSVRSDAYAADGGAVYLRMGQPVGGSLDFADTREGSTTMWDARWGTGRARSALGTALAAGDFNGDGETDLVMSAPEQSRPGVDQGGVFIWHGPIALGEHDIESASVTFTGAASGAQLGTSLDVADLDGDGFDDLLIGAAGAETAYLVYGSASWSNNTIDAVADASLTDTGELGRHVAFVGDLDGDGAGDLGAGAPFTGGLEQGAVHLVYGTAGRLSGALTSDAVLSGDVGLHRVGLAFTGPGDVNGDGVDDLLVGGNGNKAWLLYGGTRLASDAVDDLADSVFLGDFSAALGRMVDAPGDVNADGFDDMLIGGPRDDVGGRDAGVVWLLYGSATLPTTLEADDLESRGRLDGDATLSAANIGGVEGAVLLGAEGDELGRHIASGDINGDGSPDVVLGAPKAASQRGRAFVLLGGAYGLDAHGPVPSGSLESTYTTWYTDADYDGQGDPLSTPFEACEMHVPMDVSDPDIPLRLAISDVSMVTDCDDSDADTYDGAFEQSLTDNVDSNCDGVDGYAGNTPPTAPGVTITGDPTLGAGNDLVCSMTAPAADADGDTLTYRVDWFTDGAQDFDGDNLVNARDVRPYTRSHWEQDLDFSELTQGNQGWHYRWQSGSGVTEDMIWGATLGPNAWKSINANSEAYILDTHMRPASEANSWTSMEWQAPADASVRVDVVLYKWALGGDGVRARLDAAGSMLFDQTLDANDDIGHTYSFTVSLTAGELLRFQLNSVGDDAFDETVYDVQITTLNPGLDTDGDGTPDDLDACRLGTAVDADDNGIADDCERVPYTDATTTPTTATVPGVDVAAGADWVCTITAHDGVDHGPPGSASVEVN